MKGVGIVFGGYAVGMSLAVLSVIILGVEGWRVVLLVFPWVSLGTRVGQDLAQRYA